MARKRVIPMIVISALVTILVVGMLAYLIPVQSVVPGLGEPQSLKDIVEYPDPVVLTDVDEAEKGSELGQIMGGVEGFSNISDFLQGKGYHFDNASATISYVGGLYTGRFLSWWSDMGPNGTRALIVAALMDDATNMVMGAITNLLPPELVPGIDPYIIVNAMPYLYVTWYYWVSPIATIHTWHYWWYDSHSHPNWFWGVYWWWRTDVEYYWLRGAPYVSWWWLFWHWTYWRNWYWWSTYFPY